MSFHPTCVSSVLCLPFIRESWDVDLAPPVNAVATAAIFGVACGVGLTVPATLVAVIAHGILCLVGPTPPLAWGELALAVGRLLAVAWLTWSAAYLMALALLKIEAGISKPRAVLSGARATPE